MSFRETGKEALRVVLNKERNIGIIEQHFYQAVVNEYISSSKIPDLKEDDISSEELTDLYLENMHQLIYDISSGKNLKELLKEIKAGHIQWDHSDFQTFRNRLDERNNFIEKPFEVEEGALECRKCGSKRVYYYQRQLRSADEPMTTFATCCQCGAKWTYSG